MSTDKVENRYQVGGLLSSDSGDEIISSDWGIPSGASIADDPPMQRTETSPTIRWYVMDAFAANMQAAVVSGPFDSQDAAETDRRAVNIADDCEVMAFRFDPRQVVLSENPPLDPR